MTTYARAFADQSVAVVARSPSLNAAGDAEYFVVAAGANDLEAEAFAFLKERFEEGRILIALDAGLARDWPVPTAPLTDLHSLPQEGRILYVLDHEGE
jgi:hypothetical protein